MLQSEVNEYMSTIILPRQMTPRMGLLSTGGSFAKDIITPGKENGAVVGEAVVGLTDRLSEQNAEDVMNCVSLAQQIAESRFKKESNLGGWTDEYYKALRMMGWNTVNYHRQQYSPSATSFSMDQIAMEIIRAAAGGGKELVDIAQKALIGTEKDDKAVNLLENNSASESYGTFQTLPCTESGRGVPTMIMMSIDFRKTVRTRKVLFFKFQKTQVNICRSAGQFQLNTRHYANVRNRIEDMLFGAADDYLAGIQL
ncbi:hypothetical protein F7234_12145 [Pseudomonas putida]|uniref:hypothetical protein n=1 Tax=Pseudomonas putida TaxID=303 RepID=UPI00125F217F|nr:hypothetical protein [Pseudomonas putida]KAB5624018.1 hypothetical protein F7234_12145 [Pseudomonas putida]